MDFSLLQNTPAGLSARPVSLCSPSCAVLGEHFDLRFLCDDHPLLSSSETPWQVATIWGLRDRLHAIELPLRDRVAFVFPYAPPYARYAMALLPELPIAGVRRVVESGALFPLRTCSQGYTELQRKDEELYAYLSSLLSRVRLLRAIEPQRCVEVSDRVELSEYLLDVVRLIERVFGCRLPIEGLRPFPVRYPYAGILDLGQMRQMMLAFALGAFHAFSPRVLETICVKLDEHMLLPRVEFSVGNKTPLPPEWKLCKYMAKEQGMFFDVKRTRCAVHVRFCPLIPHTSPTEFYSVRHSLPFSLEY